MNDNSVLEMDNTEGSDFTLKPGADSVWVTVDGLAVYIYRDPYGWVGIDVYESGNEMGGRLVPTVEVEAIKQ